MDRQLDRIDSDSCQRRWTWRRDHNHGGFFAAELIEVSRLFGSQPVGYLGIGRQVPITILANSGLKNGDLREDYLVRQLSLKQQSVFVLLPGQHDFVVGDRSYGEFRRRFRCRF